MFRRIGVGMRKTFRSLIIGFLLFFLLCIGGGVFYLKLNTTAFLNMLLKKISPQVRIGKAEISYPFHLKLSQVHLEEIGWVEKVEISLNLFALLTRTIFIEKIIIDNPHLILVRERNGELYIGSFRKAGKREEGKKRRVRIIVASAQIRKGEVEFRDNFQGRDFRMKVKDIYLSVGNLAFPFSEKINFAGSCRIVMNKGEGEVCAEGWLDLMHKAMEGRIEIKKGNILYFNPYLPFLAKIFTSGRFNALIKLKGVEDKLRISCHLTLLDVSLKRKDTENIPILGGLISSVQELGKRALSLKFTLNTRLSAPQIDKMAIKKALVKAISQNLAAFPIEAVEKQVEIEAKEIGSDMQIIKKTLEGLKEIWR